MSAYEQPTWSPIVDTSEDAELKYKGFYITFSKDPEESSGTPDEC